MKYRQSGVLVETNERFSFERNYGGDYQCGKAQKFGTYQLITVKILL